MVSRFIFLLKFIFNKFLINFYYSKNKNYFIDLHIFGKPEDEGRTEDPTVYKEKKAREEGKVSRSQELTSSFLLMMACLIFFIFGSYFFDELKVMMKSLLKFESFSYLESDLYVFLYKSILFYIFILLPFALWMILMALGINLFQVGFFISLKPLRLDFSKVQFKADRFMRLFFSQETVFNLVKSVLKITFLFLISFVLLYLSRNEILYIGYATLEGSLDFFLQKILYLAAISSFIFIILSIPDYFYQKFRLRESLKMTRYELKQERKDVEGESQMKQRVRERQQMIMRSHLKKEVPKADVVIVNPTHYAVAIGYQSELMDAPKVYAKGKGIMALKIRELAQKHSIEIVENADLAKLLYKMVKVGETIPENFYQVIAEILAFVMNSKNKLT